MAKLTKEDIRDAIMTFVDTGNPSDSVYEQMKEHFVDNGQEPFPYLIGAEVTKEEVQKEIDAMVEEGILKRRKSRGFEEAFCGSIDWLVPV